MATEISADRFERIVLDAIRAEIEQVAEEEIAAAHQRIAQRVRERIATIAISLCTEVNFASYERAIVMTIRDPQNPRSPHA